MKKIKYFAIIFVLLFSAIIIPGCFKSNKATINDCYKLYYSALENYNTEAITVTFNEQNFAFNVVSFNYSANTLLNEDLNTGEYFLIKNDLPQLLKNSLEYFKYYQNHLKALTIENEIEQSLKTDLYESLENYEKYIKAYMNSKAKLETLYDENSKETSLIEEKFNNCISDYFNLIRASLEVSEKTEKVVLSISPFSLGNFTASDARNSVLSASLYLTKIVVNYYEQYIQMNGVTTINNASAEFSNFNKNYQNTLINFIDNDVTFKDKNFTSCKNEIQELIASLDNLKVLANEMQVVNNKLGASIPSVDENFELYYYGEIYNSILSKDVITTALSNAIDVYSV